MTCALQLSAKDVAYGPLVLAYLANKQAAGAVKVTVAEDLPVAAQLTSHMGLKFTKPAGVMRYLCRTFLADLYETHFGVASPDKATTIDSFLADTVPASGDLPALRAYLDRLNAFLALRSYMVGFHATLADFHVWSQLRGTPAFLAMVKSGAAASGYPFVLRWFRTIDEQPGVTEAVAHFTEQVNALNKQKKDQGSFDIHLPGAEMGQVVTRFPPEPSGYLHIGHAKAALLNEYFARKYNGKLIVRFDDTNPDKEKQEFEDTILEDLLLLGIKPDLVTHTSDHFPLCLQLAEKMIREGNAYVDDTDQETMRHERMHGIASKCRDNSVAENLRRWTAMQQGTDEGLRNCVRAKLSVDDKNKALRDPVLYRTNLTPHHKVGTTYKVYPTYDFACPIVDAAEGVTHALRANEYRDRNPQYEWMLEKMALRKVHIWDFSRMNFVYTLLSKRKLQWFVDQGHVGGWDDPRFPTVRGIRRRGMTIDALKQYILMQGASTNTILLEWDKFWAVNKKVIDPVAPRHVALDAAGLVPVALTGDGVPAKLETKPLPKHKKNADVGTKQTAFAKHLVLAAADAQAIADGEEVTLMDWGNAICTRVHRDADSGTVTRIDATLNLAGDVKATKKKLTWLVDPAKYPATAAQVTLIDYDYLITKKKLEEDDDYTSVLTPVTEFATHAVGDTNLAQLKAGDIIQLERRGYFICDAVDGKKKAVTLIAIPDGKAASLASKHGVAAAAAAAAKLAATKAAPAKKSAAPAPVRAASPTRAAVPNGPASPKKNKKKAANQQDEPIMYPIKSVYGTDGFPFDTAVFDIMYPVKNPYHA
ncbi:glutamate--tRNA ligase [Blastocladiella emersonii ATCC 22665]|nr:glutamate--tRNA ligase [Blastocladiella emersonii ATCC 22665]